MREPYSSKIILSRYPVLHKPVQADALMSVIRELTQQG
jgi:hypothetical protein